MSDLTPYQRGFNDGLNGKPGPSFPRGDATWEQKLYNRGWSSGTDQRLKAEKDKV